MNSLSKLFFTLAVVSFTAVINLSCKKDFDQPEGPTDDVNIVPNTSIQGLKTYHTIAGALDVINQDVIISGIVVANDKSGNFYKQLFIQDSTGAMQIMLDASSLYTSYPVGRRVYVKCKGLTLSDYYGNMQLGVSAVVGGTPSIEAIPGALINQYIVGGSINNAVEPITVNINELGTALNDKYINALVKLESYEFVAADTSKTYSDTSAYKSTQNRLISTGCNSNVRPTVRTSAYSNFAGVKLPKGNGSITAVYTIYKSSFGSATKQLIIRDTNDVKFYGSRCGTTGGGTGGATDPRITIAALRALYNNADIKLTTPASISGVVTSDAVQKNISTGAVIIQDETAAITLYYGGTIPFVIGDSISLNVTNDSLIFYRGILEVKKPFGAPYPPVISTGRTVNPLVKTIAELNASLDAPLGSPSNLEGRLVRVLNATASGANYNSNSGNNTLTDATGSIVLRTSSTALFAPNPIPTGERTWTGHIKNYTLTTSTKQISMRNTNDVQ